ncbi:DUF2087 domain-containing protein [Sporosalibacterium faouarense]|uniref:DUF2087 domain-containing protein n=1 Tax=Sporosalibacterium faouarense TaxID=516123 RepID=UPI00141C6837|nr:DUF2087 domain-containing protein [Sporosalibacterium faouarense]MTI47385.1 DUF2087 domain-containing protein [Bacillota bacterium]
MKDIDKLFWDGSVKEVKQGYRFDKSKSEYLCLICGEVYEEGVIYPQEDGLYSAKKAIENHISMQHGDMFNYLISMNKKFTGLTDTQKEILMYFYQGLSDKEIVKEQGGGSTSTIRNHRFKLKEKQRQSKLFLALMNLLEEKNIKTSKEPNIKETKRNNNKQEFVAIHKGATMIDERFAITREEKDKILNRYVTNGKIETLPSKEKRRIILLQYIIEKFESNQEYTEDEVNEVIKGIYDDYVTIRRYLIQYGFMDRKRDCSLYWLKV